MTIELPEQETVSKPRNNTSIIYVSLYFLLLAFFIYLHSISVPAEEKIQKVIGSIDFAFKGIKQTVREVKAKELAGDELGLATFHAEIRKVYETAIPLVESDVNEEGDSLRFTVPVSQLFKENDDTLRDTRTELFQDASRILIKRASVAPTDLEIMIEVPERLPSVEEFKNSAAGRQLNTLVNSFLDQGVPARNIFIGMKSSETANIFFRFYLRNDHQQQFQPAGEDQ